MRKLYSSNIQNLVTKKGQVRTAAEGMKGIEIGKQILSEQQYEFVDFTETDDKIIAQGLWTGTMKLNAGLLKQGQQLKAYLCVIIEFKDDKIYRVRNYDCYEV